MTIFDILFLLLFAVVIPTYSVIQFRKALREGPDVLAANRRSYYQSTIVFQWLLGIAVVALWATHGRDWTLLGFGFDMEGEFWIALGIVIATLSYFYRQLQMARSGPEAVREKFLKEFGGVIPILPHNKGDLRYFYGVSLTAGIIEEILFRGFFIWLTAQFMPVWAAAIIGIVLFALAHSYQGAKQFPALLAVSAVLMIVFLLSGSLWLPMIFHTLFDIIQGKLAYEVIGDDDLMPEGELDVI